jgi:hypothetical protein
VAETHDPSVKDTVSVEGSMPHGLRVYVAFAVLQIKAVAFPAICLKNTFSRSHPFLV